MPRCAARLTVRCSRSGSPSRRDSKRQRSEAAGGSEPALASGEGGNGAAAAPGADGAVPAGDGGSGDGPAAMEAEEGGEEGGSGGGVELDGEVTAEEIMMMQQMGIPFVSAGSRRRDWRRMLRGWHPEPEACLPPVTHRRMQAAGFQHALKQHTPSGKVCTKQQACANNDRGPCPLACLPARPISLPSPRPAGL